MGNYSLRLRTGKPEKLGDPVQLSQRQRDAAFFISFPNFLCLEITVFSRSDNAWDLRLETYLDEAML